MHWKLAYPSEYLNAADLLEKTVNVTIEKMAIEDVPGVDGKKKPKLVATFRGHTKRWPVPKCCAKEIAAAYGKDTDGWPGHVVQLYPTECMAFGQTVECIRIRVPAGPPTGTKTTASQTKVRPPDPAGTSPQAELASALEGVPFDAFVQFVQDELGNDLTSCGSWDEVPRALAAQLLKQPAVLVKCRKAANGN